VAKPDIKRFDFQIQWHHVRKEALTVGRDYPAVSLHMRLHELIDQLVADAAEHTAKQASFTITIKRVATDDTEPHQGGPRDPGMGSDRARRKK
jgi:hypothetical protein